MVLATSQVGKDMKRVLPLIALTVTATIVDWVVINYVPLGNWGWTYIIGGWFVVWLLIFFIVKRKWLVSIGTVMIVSIMEDVLFLLWDRIVGIIPWSSQWYCHDWMPGCLNWYGIPSYYFIELALGIALILWGRRK